MKKIAFIISLLLFSGIALTNLSLLKLKNFTYSSVLSVGSYGMKQWALDGLDNLGPYAIPGYQKALNDKNRDIKCHALSSLGTLGGQAHSAVLNMVYLLHDDSYQVRMRSCHVLSDVICQSTYRVFPAYDMLSAHPSVEKQYKGKKGYITRSQVINEIAMRLYDNNEDVREAAGYALWKIGQRNITPESLDFLNIACQDESHRVRYWAEHTLVGSA